MRAREFGERELGEGSERVGSEGERGGGASEVSKLREWGEREG